MTLRLRSLCTLSLVLVGSAAITVACGKDEGGDEHSATEPQVCKDISSVCHDLDTGSGMAHDCHEQAHAGDPAVCEMISADCIAFCTGGNTSGTDTGSTSTPQPTSTTDAETTTSAEEDTTAAHDTTAGHDDTTDGHDDTTAGHDTTDGHDTGGAVCDLLGTGCHDVATPEGQACHDLGHDGDEAACEEALAMCTKVCGL